MKFALVSLKNIQELFFSDFQKIAPPPPPQTKNEIEFLKDADVTFCAS